MKKHLFVTLLALVMLFPLQGAFAKAKNSAAKERFAVSVPQSERINAFRIDKIIGSGVINLEGERIGTIDDLVVDIDTGNVMYAAIKSGGFLGFGEKLFAVPWQSLTAVPTDGIFILDQSKAKLKKASSFYPSDWPDVGDKSWGAGIYEFFRHQLPSASTDATPATQPDGGHHIYPPFPGYTPEPNTYPSIWQNLYGDLFDPQKIETVTGKIVKVEFSNELKLMIYTETKTPVIVAIGPTGYFESQQKVLNEGDKVTVTGSRIVIDDTPILIATKITEGNQELQVRDNQGHPIWIGWKQSK
jgi:sporulation protein YlmC with PRC-barrel domain